MLPYRLLSIFACFFVVFPASAQSIQSAIDRLRAYPELAGATVAVDVIDLASGQRIAAYQADKALIPASTQKLLTTGVALDILGPKAVFNTQLAHDGRIENGVLTGNLYIVGGGDPSLASPLMEGTKAGEVLLAEWIAAVRGAGIREIRGSIIADDSYFGTTGISMGWPWADLGNYYGVGAYGLNWHENFYYLDFNQRQSLGSTPSVWRTRPFVPGLRFYNEVRTAGANTGDNAYIYGAPFNYDNYLRGTIPAGSGRFTIKGSIPDPALFVAQLLTEALEEEDFKVTMPPTSSRISGAIYPGNGTVLHRQNSPPLSEIAGRTNLRSINLFAEALLRQINKARGVADHELSSTEAMMEYLENELRLDVSTTQLNDGSGLSPRNFFPPALMTAFLRAKAEDAVFRETIPLAGRTGSMRNYLKGTAAEGRLYAKSGSVNAVRCYAGYAFPADGRQLAFSVMVNNYANGRGLHAQLLDFMEALCKAN